MLWPWSKRQTQSPASADHTESKLEDVTIERGATAFLNTWNDVPRFRAEVAAALFAAMDKTAFECAAINFDDLLIADDDTQEAAIDFAEREYDLIRRAPENRRIELSAFAVVSLMLRAETGRLENDAAREIAYAGLALYTAEAALRKHQAQN